MNKLKERFTNRKKGFTLIELLVVIAILGILVLLAAPKFLGYTKDANVAAMRADAKVLSNAALIYNIEEEGTWPVDTGAQKYTITIGSEPAITTITATSLRQNEFQGQIKNLKNDFASYAIVTDKDSELEGEVFYIGKIVEGESDLKGIEDRDGNVHFGVSLEDTAEEPTTDNVEIAKAL